MPRITRGGLVLGAVVFSSAAVLLFGGHRFEAENHSGTPPSAPAADASLAVSTPARATPLPESTKTRAMPLTAQRAREQAIPAAVVLIIAVVSVAVLLKRGRT
ncbi:hypothetical protein [Mycolicibacterium rhodesiae]|uniref:Uncharacterized protein n=1 Tax=Mycolicibacterium rhodesiae TaxID=36814 RepID=A0A1X0IRJ7_MYCRH|nr:hypothetical protein [Mycolicibacterium rhodesiae]MCV7347789.1 hypothetical protein [Mycolicibacterium rhodesiae]ORB50458.1 hypothetical protein BST42_19805 [Mycolicibacterium rhodesiae]